MGRERHRNTLVRRATWVSSAGSFLQVRTNWWAALALILPMAISYRTMEVGLPRLILLSAFLLVFLIYFHLARGAPLRIHALRPLTKVLSGFSMVYLLILMSSSFVAFNKQAALYAHIRYLMLALPVVFIALTVFREEDRFPRLCQALAVVLILHSTIAIFQIYHLGFMEIPPPRQTLPHGLMGNRNLLGSFLVLLFPFCAYLVYAGERRWKIAGGVALWLGTYGVILSQTRAAWIALLSGIVLANAIVVALRRRFGNPFLRSWFKGMALFVLGTIAALLLSAAIPNQEGLQRSLLSRGSTLVRPQVAHVGRLPEWQTSWAMLRDHPLLGTGTGNWQIVAQRYGYSRLRGYVAPHNAHSVYLHTAAETGLPGLLSFLGIWCSAALLAAKVIMESGDNRRRMLGIACLTCIAVYAVNSLANFPDECYAHSLLIALALGTSVGIHQRSAAATPAAPCALSSAQRSLLVLLACFLSFCVYFGFVKARFEIHGRRAIGYHNLKNYSKVLDEVEAARNRLVTLSTRAWPLETYAVSAHIYLGQFDQARAMARRALALNPWDLQFWMQTARAYSSMNQWDDALRCYEQLMKMLPDSDDVLRGAGPVLYHKGRFRESRDVLVKSSYLESESSVYWLGRAHLQLKEFDHAVRVWREGLLRFPESTNLLENLAFVEYTHLRDFTNAYARFQKLLTLNPDHAKRNEYTNVMQYLSRRLFGTPNTKSAMPPVSPAD